MAAGHVYEYDAGRSGFRFAIEDLRASLSKPGLLFSLTKSGFIDRHSGWLSAIFWLGLTYGASVAGLALIYGQIMQLSLSEYLPFIACGLLFWSVIATCLNDSAGVFLAASGIYTQAALPKALFVLRSIGIQLLAFLIRMAILLAVFVYIGNTFSIQNALMSLAGLALTLWTGFWLAILIGPIALRFRDMPSLMHTFVTFGFFATPVFWPSDRLEQLQFIVELNPLAHFIEFMRAPLIGGQVDVSTIAWCLACALGVSIAGMASYAYTARRIVYWS
jgi:ABC-type polysaccharide/polyol phosphate export permease